VFNVEDGRARNRRYRRAHHKGQRRCSAKVSISGSAEMHMESLGALVATECSSGGELGGALEYDFLTDQQV
jgi:hypothetical protein